MSTESRYFGDRHGDIADITPLSDQCRPTCSSHLRYVLVLITHDRLKQPRGCAPKLIFINRYDVDVGDNS
jgi:hypothetical protein